MNWTKFGTFLAVALFAGMVQADGMKITEWMYNSSGAGGEFVEFTNVSNSAIDMTGWSYDDNDRSPGHLSLSAFGTVAPGESVIVSEVAAATFRTEWGGLPLSLKVIGPYSSDNLGRSDEINLYDNTNALIDRLTFNDQGSGTVAGPRTSGVSGNILLANLGSNNASLAVLSVNGDSFGSHISTIGDIGNPGAYTPFVPVPEPATLSLAVMAAGVFAAFGCRKSISSRRKSA